MHYVKLRTGFKRLLSAGSGLLEKYQDAVRKPYALNPELREQALTILQFAIMGSAHSLCMLIFFGFAGIWEGIVLFSVLVLLLPFWYWALRYQWLKIKWIAHLFIFTVVSSSQVIIFLSDGLHSPFFAWQILSPIAAIQLANWRGLAAWGSVSFVCMFVWFFGDIPSNSALIFTSDFNIRTTSHILLLFAHLSALMVLLSSQKTILSTQSQLESELEKSQHLITDVVKGQLEERGRLYRELSDELGPMLTQLQGEQAELGKKGSIPSENVDGLRQALSTIEVELERISQNLESSDLDKNGFYVAILNLCQHLENTTAATVDLNMPDGVTIAMNTRSIHVYRIVQEALRNIARHAQATKAQVTLRIEAGQVVAVHVEDNGKGMAASAAQKSTTTSRFGQGLQNIADRVALLNGYLAIDAPADGGTRIRISLTDPIHQRLRLPFK